MFTTLMAIAHHLTMAYLCDLPFTLNYERFGDVTAVVFYG